MIVLKKNYCVLIVCLKPFVYLLFGGEEKDTMFFRWVGGHVGGVSRINGT